jgi:hypothetical protein
MGGRTLLEAQNARGSGSNHPPSRKTSELSIPFETTEDLRSPWCSLDALSFANKESEKEVVQGLEWAHNPLV